MMPNTNVFVVKTNFCPDVSSVDDHEFNLLSCEFGGNFYRKCDRSWYPRQFGIMHHALLSFLGDVHEENERYTVTVTRSSIESYFRKMQEKLHEMSNINEKSVEDFMDDFFNIRRLVNARDICWIYTGYFKSTAEFLLALYNEMCLNNAEDVTITMVQAIDRCC